MRRLSGEMTAFSVYMYISLEVNMKKKVELLAPAGDFSCFQAAINAGADAVYLGGTKFGARAYANNFTEEELIEALRIAHLFDRRIYLTVNTLVKEKELGELVPYIEPLYRAGLDGVIIQDIGVLQVLRENFPGLELHASTQMTITGSYGAEFMKNLGICRVVPARELSLDEIKDIKVKTGLEIETFIHGAMCYAYSGQCLFSSIIGGRSGNRGRCAGPCRLPYMDEKGKTIYPLSLKDMYTLPFIPKLIEAGIDSFKIEGRMKSPEYVAGVTAIYRKYIDGYILNPDKPYNVEKQDEELLRGLYIRTDICNGYYEQHNDKSMVTIKEPGYSGSSPDVLNTIRQKYLAQKPSIAVQGYVRIYADTPALFTLSCDKASVTVEGEVVSTAVNRPLDEAEIKNRLGKMGDTFFIMEQLEVDTDGVSFMPVRALNELRRLACSKLEQALSASDKIRKMETGAVSGKAVKNQNSDSKKDGGTAILSAAVMKAEQLEEALKFPEIRRIYIDADLLIAEKGISLPDCTEKELYLVLPHILRKRSYQYLAAYRQLLEGNCFKGVMVRNVEELQWLINIDYKGQIIADYSIYAWNTEAVRIWEHFFDRMTLPVELNRRELQDLSAFQDKELLIYGRLPLMYSANCIRKTTDRCIKNDSLTQNIYRLTDRYKNIFPVLQNCHHCYNILYNTVPLSLHGQLKNVKDMECNTYRLDFTTETGEETRKLLDYYRNAMYKSSENNHFPLKDFTNGHYKRGVE